MLFLMLGRRDSAPVPPSAAEFSLVEQAVTHVGEDVALAVGSGGLRPSIQPVTAAAPPLDSGPKPRVLYIGAEFCPYCAGERWSLVAALSRFGTFSGLQPSWSSATDIYPNTPTFTFEHATFTSTYLDFVAVETQTRDMRPLHSPTPEQQQVFNRLNPAGSIPFVDIANAYVVIGSGFQLDVLRNKSWPDIARGLADPTSPLARSIVGHANALTAAMCRVTDGQPAAVCSAPYVRGLP